MVQAGAEPLGSLMSLPKRQKATKVSGRLDENEVVLISDMHVLAGSHTPARLTRVVDEVLAMRPLPANVIGLGDLANLYGHVHNHPSYRSVSSRSACVSVERIGYTPVLLETLRDKMLEAEKAEK